MKATIAGITVEGTPQEIADYQRLTAKQDQDKLLRQIAPDTYELQRHWWHDVPLDGTVPKFTGRQMTISQSELNGGAITVTSKDIEYKMY